MTFLINYNSVETNVDLKTVYIWVGGHSCLTLRDKRNPFEVKLAKGQSRSSIS